MVALLKSYRENEQKSHLGTYELLFNQLIIHKVVRFSKSKIWGYSFCFKADHFSTGALVTTLQ